MEFNSTYKYSPSYVKQKAEKYKNFKVNSNWMNNLFAVKFIYMMTNDFIDWKAFDMGLIDENGKQLKKPTSIEEKNEYNYFVKSVISLKRLLIKYLPDSRLNFITDSLFLLRESKNQINTITTFFNKLDKLNVKEINRYITEEFLKEDTLSSNISSVGGGFITKEEYEKRFNTDTNDDIVAADPDDKIFLTKEEFEKKIRNGKKLNFKRFNTLLKINQGK